MAARQKIIETNRSLRTIKNELEALLEKGAISDEAYESIHAALPSESPLSSAPAPAAPAPVPRVVSPPTNGMAAMNIHHQPTPPPQQQPPSYNQTTAAAPPALPTRNQPTPAPPSKPVIAHARALYRYQASDARDCSFEKDDRIAVYEYMNADWWMGRNERTGQEGIFPKSYVEPTGPAGPPPSHSPYPNEKAGFNGYAAPAQPTYGGYPPPAPAQQNPYNNNVPPMAVAEGSGQPAQEGDGKGKEMGKKFGKKLGNAAIFGAGATIGSNIVNSIF
ncbi:protein that induces appearance of [PIN+] prion when overproduced [Diaporthe eres]|uniref:Protein that induces appearance of [PIN+] prion when overproduced n=1 Tax=Diaporthe eres TaxID=83184 RepID=A0ABR1NT24_DIAER